MTNVNYEIELVANRTVKKDAHRNHLIAYFPIKNAISELVVDFGLRNESFQPFYEILMKKQIEKLNKPVDKFSFQQHLTETEFFPADNFSSNIPIIKPDRGIQEEFSTN